MIYFVAEVIAPVALFALVLWGAFRIQRFAALFSSGTARSLMGTSVVLAAGLLYWWVFSAGILSTYRRLAHARGAQSYPYPSWDVGLSYTLTLDLALLLAIACAFVARHVLRGRGSRAA